MRDQQWLSTRIWDVMLGLGYSLRKLAPKAKMNDHVELKRYLDLEKPITPSVLSDIAEGLGVTVERIEQVDIPSSNQDELDNLIKAGADMDSAYKLAKKNADIAIGATEKIKAYHNLGWVLCYSGDKEGAYKVWKDSYKIAIRKDLRKKDLNNKSMVIDEKLLFEAANDLINYHIMVGDYKSALGYLDKLETMYNTDKKQVGMIHQNKGLCLFKLGDRFEAKQRYLLSEECYRSVNASGLLGRIQLNLADIYFHEGDLERAHDLLICSMANLDFDTLEIQSIAKKDYARLLVSSGREEESLQIAKKQLNVLKTSTSSIKPELIGKFMLIVADLDADRDICKALVDMDGISQELKCNAADVMMEILLADNPDLIKYYNTMKSNLSCEVVNYRWGEWF